MNNKIRAILLVIVVGLLAALVWYFEGGLLSLILLVLFAMNVYLGFENQNLKEDRQEIYSVRDRTNRAHEQLGRLEADVYQLKKGKK